MNSARLAKVLLMMGAAFWVVAALCSCAPPDKIGMIKGSFDVPSFCDFKGAGRNLPKDTDYVGVSFSGSYAQRSEIPMDITNKRKSPYEELNGDVDFTYKTQKLQAQAVLDRMYKGQVALSGFSVGLSTDPSFFTRFFVGANMKHFEMGVFSALFFGKWEGTYHPFMYTYCGSYQSCMAYSSESWKETSRVVNGLGGYASLIVGDLAITSTISAYNAWLGKEDDMDLTFDMPYLYSLYGGASYWFTPHFKLTMGVTDVVNAKRRSLILGGSLGYWR